MTSLNSDETLFKFRHQGDGENYQLKIKGIIKTEGGMTPALVSFTPASTYTYSLDVLF
jgi:hypothetical protein